MIYFFFSFLVLPSFNIKLRFEFVALRQELPVTTVLNCTHMVPISCFGNILDLIYQSCVGTCADLSTVFMVQKDAHVISENCV